MAQLWDKSSQIPPLIFLFHFWTFVSLLLQTPCVPPCFASWFTIIRICLCTTDSAWTALKFPNLFLCLPVFWYLCPLFHLFLLFSCPLLYVSPSLVSPSSHHHSVYVILKVDRRTLGNLLLSQTFIFLSLIHQSAARCVFVQRVTKETAPAKAYLFIFLINIFAFPNQGEGPAINAISSLLSFPSNSFHCLLGPSVVTY